jgi:prolyl-tRNA editing enzyme YbaK/EbsC (Cys-tRNA(Pro) deacylase)
MALPLSQSAQRVQDALIALGLPCRVIELSTSTRTAQEAAGAVGCSVGQIVKSPVFRGVQTGRPILALVSGANRVNEARLGELAGKPIAEGDAAFVRAHTGFAIGGVAPLGRPAHDLHRRRPAAVPQDLGSRRYAQRPLTSMEFPRAI